jgi:hypothetical protein
MKQRVFIVNMGEQLKELNVLLEKGGWFVKEVHPAHGETSYFFVVAQELDTGGAAIARSGRS